MIRKFAVVCALVLATSSLSAAAELADKIEKPVFKVNDTWTFYAVDRERNGETKERHWVVTIARTGTKTIVQSVKATDSSMPPIEKLVGTDLSMTTSINGKEVLVHKPYDFPLVVGKTWTVAYEKLNPNKNLKLSKVNMEYQVVNWEEVAVPAGKFRAVKVEGEGTWYNEFKPTAATSGAVTKQDSSGATIVMNNQKSTTPAPATGRIYRSYWFSPEVKREVKFVEEEYATDGALMKRNTWELESYALDGQSAKPK
jgi:hypothetical protein